MFIQPCSICFTEIHWQQEVPIVINPRWEKRSCSNTCLFSFRFVITSLGFYLFIYFIHFICYSKVQQLQLFSYTKGGLKIVYTPSLLPTPEHIVKDLNHILYTFLWKGKDKVTGASTINNYEEGGIKMVDIESLIKSLRLSWLKRLFSDNLGA